MSRYYPPVVFLMAFLLWLYVRVMAWRGHTVSPEELAGLAFIFAPLAALLYVALCFIVAGLVFVVAYAVAFHTAAHGGLW